MVTALGEIAVRGNIKFVFVTSTDSEGGCGGRGELGQAVGLVNSFEVDLGSCDC